MDFCKEFIFFNPVETKFEYIFIYLCPYFCIFVPIIEKPNEKINNYEKE